MTVLNIQFTVYLYPYLLQFIKKHYHVQIAIIDHCEFSYLSATTCQLTALLTEVSLVDSHVLCGTSTTYQNYS